jgi:type I restriction enzyme, S subunit
VRTLSECAQFQSGGTPSKGNPAYWGGDIPWVGSGEMSQSFIYDTELRVTEEGAENGTRSIPENTVLVVVRGMSLAKEFRIAITRRPMTFNQDVKALRCALDIDPQFLFYALKARKDHIRDLATEASHGTKKLETSTLNAFEIMVPDTIEE